MTYGSERWELNPTTAETQHKMKQLMLGITLHDKKEQHLDTTADWNEGHNQHIQEGQTDELVTYLISEIVGVLLEWQSDTKTVEKI